MLLIGAIIIVSSIVIIDFSISRPSIMSEKRAMEARFEGDIFKNLLNELNNTMVFSYDKPFSITTNVFDFANFTEAKMNEHSIGFKFLYVGSIANKTTSVLNVSLINMLGATIDANFTLSDGQSNATTGIVNHGRWSTVNFTITPGAQYTLNLTYDSTTESIIIKTKGDKDVYAGLYYVSLEGADSTHTGKYQKTFNLE